MKAAFPKKTTVFFVISLLSILGIIVSSLIMINQNGMNQRLQGWVNLLWLPLPIVILVIDRICIRKFEAKDVNRIQFYILGTLIFLFTINVIRLQLQ